MARLITSSAITHTRTLLFLLCIAGSQAGALNRHPNVAKRQDCTCPKVWEDIGKDLGESFVFGEDCNGFGRASIKYAFHDAASFSLNVEASGPASGGADGSLLLSDEEITRDENSGLPQYHEFITEKYAKYKSEGVGAADFVQFAGSVGIVSCTGGPTVRTVIGREDYSEPAPEHLLPNAFGEGSDHDTIHQLFLDKGISARELAALLGAHTCSRNHAQEEIPIGIPQDSTPAVWDVQYYSDTYKPPPEIARFDSDVNLSDVNTTVGQEFQSYVGNQDQWTADFAPAMARLGLLGVPASKQSDFIDCTDALPKPKKIKSRRRRGMMGIPHH